MKILILLAKASIGFLWLVLLGNIVSPFPGGTAMVLYIMAAFLFCMHCLQLLIFVGAFGDTISMTRWEKYSILIFGVFALLGIRQKYMLEK